MRHYNSILALLLLVSGPCSLAGQDVALTNRTAMGGITALRLSSDGRLLFTASSQSVRLWDVASFGLVRAYQAFSTSVISLDVSGGAAFLLVGQKGGVISVIETATGRQVAESQVRGPVEAVAWECSSKSGVWWPGGR